MPAQMEQRQASQPAVGSFMPGDDRGQGHQQRSIAAEAKPKKSYARSSKRGGAPVFCQVSPCCVTAMFVDLSDTRLLRMLGAAPAGPSFRQAKSRARMLHLVLYTPAQAVTIWPVSGEVRCCVKDVSGDSISAWFSRRPCTLQHALYTVCECSPPRRVRATGPTARPGRDPGTTADFRAAAG